MAETETPDLTVDEAMIAVMRELDPVGKHGHNKTQNYRFQAYDDIVAEVGPRMAKYGLRMLPEVVNQQHFTRGAEGRVNVAILTIRYVIRGPLGDELDTPIVVVGEGADTSDKASNKAMTAAKKYAYKQAFEISDGEDDGDHDHPVDDGQPSRASSPLTWFISQIRRPEVWQNEQTLHALYTKAVAAGVANLHMPDNPGVTFGAVVDAQGVKLHAENEARAKRLILERQARRAQISAEYPDPPDPYDDVWDQATPQHSTPPAPVWEQQPPATPALPDAETIEQQLADAVADPATAAQSLHALRARHGAAVLAQVVVRSEWGSLDANSAITMALLAKPAVQQKPEPEPERSVKEEAPAPEPPQAAPEQPRKARRSAGMTAQERAQANMIAEVEFQAQMLGEPTLEFVADLLPEGATSTEDIRGGSRLMDHIKEHRALVLEALKTKGLTHVAEEYEKFGDRVPARNFNRFIETALQKR